MSNSPFSKVPEDASDPVVDQELRDFMQRFSVGPTAEEQSRFWDDLSEKLPEQKTSFHLFSPVQLKRYFPWTALASVIAVVLLLLVQPGERGTQQAVLSDPSEGSKLAPLEASKPMVLGAAPAAKRSQQAPFGLLRPDFDVRWEPVSEKVFLVYVATQDRERLRVLAKEWPSGLVLTEVPERSAEKKQITYRLEDRR